MNFPSMNQLDTNVHCLVWAICQETIEKTLNKDAAWAQARWDEMRCDETWNCAQRTRFRFLRILRRNEWDLISLVNAIESENWAQVVFELKFGTPQVKCSTASDLGQVCSDRETGSCNFLPHTRYTSICVFWATPLGVMELGTS